MMATYGRLFSRVLAVSMASSILLTMSCSRPQGTTLQDKRTYARDMRDRTLEELYERRPEAKAKVQRAAGYAVFSDLGVNVILLSAGQGYGVAVDNQTGKETFMNMAQVGVGLGLGLKDFRAVFIFGSEGTYREFIYSGWEFGAHADAAAVSGEKGGQASGAASFQDIEIYQFTKSGIALQASIAGTKYWQDRDLNVD